MPLTFDHENISNLVMTTHIRGIKTPDRTSLRQLNRHLLYQMIAMPAFKNTYNNINIIYNYVRYESKGKCMSNNVRHV
jgi:hypothetical protein